MTVTRTRNPPGYVTGWVLEVCSACNGVGWFGGVGGGLCHLCSGSGNVVVPAGTTPGGVSMPAPPWFLLYDGTSADGLGPPRYCGRTPNKQKAREHYLKVSSNPYSVGKVEIVTDDAIEYACPFTNWEAL